MKILKEEINQLSSDILDIFKWKVTIIASFAGLGLGWVGWGVQNLDTSTGVYLLSFVGFLCAYMDSIYYRRTATIHAIAKYLREYSGNDKEMIELKKFEQTMSEYRNKGLFYISDRWPQFIASMIFAIGLPLLGMLQKKQFSYIPFFISILALTLNIILFMYYNLRRKMLRDIKK